MRRYSSLIKGTLIVALVVSIVASSILIYDDLLVKILKFLVMAPWIIVPILLTILFEEHVIKTAHPKLVLLGPVLFLFAFGFLLCFMIGIGMTILEQVLGFLMGLLTKLFPFLGDWFIVYAPEGSGLIIILIASCTCIGGLIFSIITSIYMYIHR